MIFFDSHNKVIFIFILAGVALSFIFFQWFKQNPFTSTKSYNVQLWDDIKSGTSDRTTAIIDSMHLGFLQLKDFEETSQQQAKQKELVKITEKYISQKNIPQTQKECETMAGEWGVFGAENTASCKVVYIDAGQQCADSNQCRGQCIIIDWPESYQAKWSQGESVAMTGFCSQSNFLPNCFGLVEGGMVSGVDCQ